MSSSPQTSDVKTPLKIAIVNSDNTMTSALFGITDIFSLYNKDLSSEYSKTIETTIVRSSGEKKPFNPAAIIKDTKITLEDNYDIVIVPPIIDAVPDTHHKDDELHNWLIHMYQQGSTLVSVCVGVHTLAQTGILNGKTVTTHWLIQDMLQQKYPKVKVDTSKIIIEDNRVITAGGVSAYIDLCLYIISKYITIDAAYRLANILIVDAGRSSQLHYKNLSMIFVGEDDEIQRSSEWIKKHYMERITVDDIANAVGLNKRTFLRRFQKSTGFKPIQYLQNIRIEKAKELLTYTNKNFEDITSEVGYSNPSTFRNLFRESTDLNPRSYRERFTIKG